MKQVKKSHAVDTELLEETKKRPLWRRVLSVAVKLGLTVLALALVFTRIDMQLMWQQVHAIPLPYIITAFVSLFFSQVVSAARMRYYFADAGHPLKIQFCIPMYLTGAMVNLVLPGGISGDGYKALFLKKHKKIPALRALKLTLSERANGLFFLLLIALVCAAVSDVAGHIPYALPLLAAAVLLLVPAYVLSARLILKESLRTMLGASRFSAVSQSMVAFGAYILFVAIVPPHQLMEYLAILMVSNVIAILPLSIGGVGLRELTFYYCAVWFGLPAEQGVAASLIFFTVHMLVAMTGAFFITHLKDISKRYE